MAFTPTSRIHIGGSEWSGVHEVHITHSMHSIVNTCTIKLPTKARLRLAGASMATMAEIGVDNVQLNNVIKVGMAVKVMLGYDKKLKVEFEGFVKRLNYTTPCEVECEGYVYQLRQKTVHKSWKNTTLKELLHEATKGTDIVLHAAIPEMPLGRVVMDSQTGDQVLEWLKKEYKITVLFEGKTLYAGLAYGYNNSVTVAYKLGWNVSKDDDLKLREADETKVHVSVIHIDNTGKKTIAKAGEAGGAERTVYVSETQDAGTLKQLAERKLHETNYQGYEGSIATMLVPYATVGMVAAITDARYPERGGSYMIEAVETTYGTSGAKRKIQIGPKVNS